MVLQLSTVTLSMSTTSQNATYNQPTEHEETPLDDFEIAISELETLVESLESGDVNLKDALAHFERGVNLSRHCQTMLRSAELRIEQLTDQTDDEEVTPLTLDESLSEASTDSS